LEDLTLVYLIAGSMILMLAVGHKKLPEFLRGILMGVIELQRGIEQISCGQSRYRIPDSNAHSAMDNLLWWLFGVATMFVVLSLLIISLSVR